MLGEFNELTQVKCLEPCLAYIKYAMTHISDRKQQVCGPLISPKYQLPLPHLTPGNLQTQIIL